MAAVAEPAAGPRSVEPVSGVRGTITVAGDKSISHRAALFNAVADGEARIENYSPGADCSSTLACLAAMGVQIERQGSSVRLVGAGLRGLREPADVLDCGNSGTTMRLLSGLLAGQDFFAVLTGDASLRRRPMARVAEPLRRAGASISGRDGGRLPPLAILPVGALKGVEHHMNVASAQVKSSLVLAGLYADSTTVVHEPAASRDHTERMLAAMGADVQHIGNTITVQPAQRLRAVDVTVPGDFSSAAFWLALGCLHPDAELRVENVGLNPTRTGFLTILQQMGADVVVENARDVAGEPVGDLVARSSRLRGTTVGGELVPLAIDELPLVALLGLFAEGETVVRDAAELRVKESDRVTAVAEGLTNLGADVTPTQDGWVIRGGRPLVRGRANAQGDHRLAMLFALAGALGAGAEVEGAEVVVVSYPGFWSDLAMVAGGR